MSVLSSAYSLSKYGMTLCVLGMSQEFKDDGIAVNALWPKTGLVIHCMRNVHSKELKKKSFKRTTNLQDQYFQYYRE